MTDHDPLATPTLARLYMGQGYFDRARAVLEACLSRDATDGHALALVARLRARSDAALNVTLHAAVPGVTQGDRASVAWTAVGHADECHVIVVAITQTGTTAATWVTSTRARTAFGSWECALPFPRGSVCASVGRIVDGDWQPLAVARPVSWP